MRYLSSPGRRLALAILAGGLCTFFAPLFSTGTPGVDWVGWSPWMIASRVEGRHVDLLDVVFNQSLSGLLVVYPLMLCGLVAIGFPRPRKALVAIAAFGSFAGYEPFYWGHYNSTGRLFRSLGVTGAVHYEPAIYVLAAVMPALLWVSLSGPWDAERSTAPADRYAAR